MIRRLEQLANVAILGVCALIAYLIVMPRVLRATAVQEWLLTGSHLGIEELPAPISADSRTVLLVLDRHCQFCSRGVPFYRELAAVASKRGHRSVLLMRDNLDKIREYASAQGIPIQEVVHGDPQRLGIRSVPTVLILDERGLVRKAWVGSLDKNREASVIAAMQPYERR